LQVGCFGDVVYSVSDTTVRTIRNMKWKVTARTGSHEVHLGEPLLEFLGPGESSITYEMQLLRDLGGDPMDTIAQLLDYVRTGHQDYWILGDHWYGTGKWVLTEVEVDPKYYDLRGRIDYAAVSVTMQAVGSRRH
jgi:hypothetical protein